MVGSSPRGTRAHRHLVEGSGTGPNAPPICRPVPWRSGAGKTWSVVRSDTSTQSDEAKGSVPSRGIFIDKDHGLLIAGPAGTGMLLKSSDGGNRWSRVLADDQFYDLSFSGAKGFVIGRKGIYSIFLRKS